MDKKENWLSLAIRLQALAQAGLQYGKDKYDLERYKEIREIASSMIAMNCSLPDGKVKDLFCCETGYQTPKIDTRAVIVKDGKILLVQENNGTWSLPGGWCDVDLSVTENTVKEVYEEAGLNVRVTGVIAVQDREKHNQPVYAWRVCKIFMLCELIDGDFKQNIETVKSAYFGKDELPDLALEKNNEEQVLMCLNAALTPDFKTQFD